MVSKVARIDVGVMVSKVARIDVGVMVSKARHDERNA